jgi:phage terminase large subunit
LGLRYTTNRSEYTITVAGYGRMIFRSYDRPERIVAYEVADSIVDELDTLQKEKAAYVWRKVSERNRQKCGRPNTLGNVTTPDQGYSGFTYSQWVKKKLPGYELIKAATASNPFLPDGYIEQIRANYDPILADMYLNGEFVSLSQNKVYHFFDRKKHHTDRLLSDQDRVIHIGLDFNIGGCCANVWVIDNNKPIAVDEFVSHDTRDFCNRLERFKAQGRSIIVYPDASGRSGRTNASQSDIQIIEQAGYRTDAPQANPAVRDRVNAVNALFAHDRIAVNTTRCTRLVDALESQGYDAKGEPEKFNDHPAIDDDADAMGYFLHRKFPLIRPHSSIKVAGI